MVSPLTNEEMFDGKFQYMDSLYDGSVWVKQYAEYGNPEAGYMYTVSNIKDEETDEPMLFTYEEAVAKAQEKFPDMKPEEQLGQIFLYYKQIMLDSSLKAMPISLPMTTNNMPRQKNILITCLMLI